MQKFKLVLALLILCGSLYLSRKTIFTAAAQYLVETQDPQQADVIVVLGGDGSGARAVMGCELLQKEFAPQMWISGSTFMYGRTEASLAIEFLKAKGCPVEKMVPLNNVVNSTRDEAIAIGRMMHQQGIRRYLLVTSNFHTRRSGRIFRSVSPDLEARVVAAKDNDFQVERWWEFRHSQKTFFYEWLKTVSYWVGL